MADIAGAALDSLPLDIAQIETYFRGRGQILTYSLEINL